MDTPLVNGTAYPYVDVHRKAYRLRILNASNDRMLNLQLYYAKSAASMWNADGTLNDANAGEVPMVAAAKTTGYPATWPTDGRDGGVPDPAARGPKLVEIGTDGGMLPAPVVLDSQPVDYNYNRRDITFGNVTSKTIMLGPAERADVIVDFSAVPAGSKLVLYNDAPAPNPALDPRNDYFTGGPDQTSTGGAPTTQPGYGPNTRTIMQFRVDSSAPAATYDVTNLQTKLPAAFKASQHEPIIPQTVYNPATTNQTATSNYVRIQDNSIAFTPYGGTSATTLALQPKAIQELFETSFGRMNATLGVELPNTNINTQTTIPMGYAEPVTEVFSPSDIGTPVGSLNDGTQLWKITHNGVDTHAIHFHLMDVQLVNRVGWDGAIKPPDPNELGWKDTLRMNPLEDVVIAIRPSTPTLPFKLGDSWRPIDPTLPTTATIATFDPKTGNAITVPNAVTNYGWEYVWHCHLLGHEENDMMRPIQYKVSPAMPTGLAAAPGPAPGSTAVLTWTNAATSNPLATNFSVQRATDAGFTAAVTQFDLTPQALTTTWTDSTAQPGTSYYYRIRAENAVAYSLWTPGVSVVTATATLAAPTGLSVTDTSTPAGTPPTPQVTLGWTPSASADGYTILRATDAGFTTGLTSIPITGGTTASYLDGAVTWGTTYYYEIQAVQTTGATPGPSPWTTPAVSVAVQNGPPDVPATFTAVAGPSAPSISVGLTWSSAARATGYTIRRSVDPAFPAASTTTMTTTGTSYSDSAVLATTTYYYQVQATNAVGVSGWSTKGTVTTGAIVIPAPANLSATPATAPVSITVAWASSAGANAYDVQRATDAGFTMNVSDTIVPGGTTWTDTAVTPGTTYYYRVNASSVQGGVSPWSNVVTVTA
jgi:FtsP/CotA-like multicopper oxidase with cupredoxin domain/fibronectin type 3 domain-containing protein